MGKYIIGERIKSLDELVKCDLVYFVATGFKKIYHRGWFVSWQIHLAHKMIAHGNLYRAERRKENEEDQV